MIPSATGRRPTAAKVYQRGLVIDSQQLVAADFADVSVSKGIGD